MDEQFRGGNGKTPEENPSGGRKSFYEYYEHRSQKIQNFTLNMEEPEGYVPKFGSPVSGGDVYSYGKDEANRKQQDYIELTKSIEDGTSETDEEEDFDEKYFGENGIYTRLNRKREEVPASVPKMPLPNEHQGTQDNTEYVPLTQPKPQTAQPDRKAPASAKHIQQKQPVKKSASVSNGEIRRPVQNTAKAQDRSGTAPAGAEIKRSKQKKKMNGYSVLITVLGFLCAIVFIAAVTAGVSTFVLSAVDDILSINTDKTIVTVTIPENAEYDQIIDLLSDSGVVSQKFVCKLFAKFRHFDGYTSSETNEFVKTEYAPGIYYVEKDDGIEAILNSMKVGYGASTETVTVSFPEGWTIAQIFEKLEKKNVCEAALLYANLDITAQQYNFYEKIPDVATRYQKLEGYLFPDTYEFYVGENPNSVLSKLFDNFQQKMKSSYRNRAAELGMSTDEVLIIASILQREGTNKDQMKTISSIIHNRLNNPSSFPLLQCDSTSTYVTNYIVPNVDSYYGQLYSEAYNTYSANGLPPGPICNPGDDAINAALYPEETNYYYFCHDADGNMYVAQTYEEHRSNIARALG
ncbi:MAG: endolytic transglycosylase MltG [Clostridia bacterium]|nr:endolytic transglycosylase MltG [Clostridia bacterium]